MSFRELTIVRSVLPSKKWELADAEWLALHELLMGQHHGNHKELEARLNAPSSASSGDEDSATDDEQVGGEKILLQERAARLDIQKEWSAFYDWPARGEIFFGEEIARSLIEEEEWSAYQTLARQFMATYCEARVLFVRRVATNRDEDGVAATERSCRTLLMVQEGFHFQNLLLQAQSVLVDGNAPAVLPAESAEAVMGQARCVEVYIPGENFYPEFVKFNISMKGQEIKSKPDFDVSIALRNALGSPCFALDGLVEEETELLDELKTQITKLKGKKSSKDMCKALVRCAEDAGYLIRFSDINGSEVIAFGAAAVENIREKGCMPATWQTTVSRGRKARTSKTRTHKSWCSKTFGTGKNSKPPSTYSAPLQTVPVKANVVKL